MMKPVLVFEAAFTALVNSINLQYNLLRAIHNTSINRNYSFHFLKR